ncbi:MAG: TonB-dependent receptor [Myxococcota bacterium]
MKSVHRDRSLAAVGIRRGGCGRVAMMVGLGGLGLVAASSACSPAWAASSAPNEEESSRTLSEAVAAPQLDAPLSASAPEPESEAYGPTEEFGLESVVTATRTRRTLKDAPVPTELITRRELEAFGQQGLDGVMQQLPGVELERGFSTVGLRLQGLDPSYTLVLVDGERMIGRIDGAIDLRRFRLENIERLEIVRGASSALYGSDAIGGVVNIITRDVNQPLQSEAQSQVSGFEDDFAGLTVSGSIAHGSESGGYRLTAGLHRAERFDLDPSDLATTGGDGRIYDVSARARQSLSSRVELIGRFSYERRDQDAVDNDIGAGRAVYDRLNIFETASGSLTAKVDLTQAAQWQSRVNVGLFRNQFVLDQRNAVQGDQDQETDEWLGQFETFATVELGENHVVTAGVDLIAQNLSGERIQEAIAERRERYAAYVQDEWTLLEGLTLVPGVRVDYDSQFGSQVSPKLTTRIEPIDDVVIRGSYGAGFRAPSFNELYLIFENPAVGYVVTGNPELDAERSQSFNLNVEWLATSQTVFEVDAYANYLDNLIDFDSIGGGIGGDPIRFQYVNREDGYTTGVTLRSRFRIAKPLSVEASYGYQRARFSTETPDGEPARQDLQGRAPHRVTAALRYQSRDLGLTAVVRGQWSDRRPFYIDERGIPLDADPNLDALVDPILADAYATLDTRVAQQVGPLEIFAGVDNLLNEGHPLYLPIAPRTFFAGVKGTLDVED